MNPLHRLNSNKLHIHSHSQDLLVSTDTNLCGLHCSVIEPHSACVCVLCLCFFDQTHIASLNTCQPGFGGIEHWW